VLTDITGKQDQVAKELGDRAISLTADVSKSAEIEPVIQLAVDTYGGLDILCNVAGIPGALVAMVDTTEEGFDQLINVNLRGVFLTMRAAIPHMIARGGGAIVNIASTAALIGTPELGVYAASKAGVVALTKVAAVEYGKHAIRVNAICPGVIETPMYTAGVAENPGMVEYLSGLVPLGRIGQPEEIASTMLFLASSASSYITGTVIPVEGGQVTT
jgi:NAD(P)-dependent dehydrogenase (short-subunit alcohol dehydrogenase family)